MDWMVDSSMRKHVGDISIDGIMPRRSILEANCRGLMELGSNINIACARRIYDSRREETY